MKSVIAMCLGALVGLSLLAWSLDTLVPEDARRAHAQRLASSESEIPEVETAE